jgi:hypothetical protein
LRGINAKSFDKGFRLVIGVGIEQLMRMTVVTEKTLEPEHIAFSARPTMIGPAPISSRPTRRRINARLCPGGQMLRNPSEQQVARCLGLVRPIDPERV